MMVTAVKATDTIEVEVENDYLFIRQVRTDGEQDDILAVPIEYAGKIASAITACIRKRRVE